MANILIIGNGFDIAHNLPTGYDKYLKQLKKDSNFYEYVKSGDTKYPISQLDELIDGNVCDFLYYKMNENDNKWVDFENVVREIIDVVANIDNFFTKKLNIHTKEYYYTVEKSNLENIPVFLVKFVFHSGKQKYEWTLGEINKLSQDVLKHINYFIHFFEEYLIWIFYKEKDKIQPLDYFLKLDIDYLLSFNYTHTYETLYSQSYGLKKAFNFENSCYVHGEIENNNKIVMGIGSEFYDRDIHEDYVELFKFYQRYKHQTDFSYQNWIECLEKDKIYPFDESNDLKNHFVSIYGHSLDPTDEDILFPFLSMKNAKIKIYYYGDDNKLKIEKNLLKILGRTRFEEYLIGNKKRIQLINCKDIK